MNRLCRYAPRERFWIAPSLWGEVDPLNDADRPFSPMRVTPPDMVSNPRPRGTPRNGRIYPPVRAGHFTHTLSAGPSRKLCRRNPNEFRLLPIARPGRAVIQTSEIRVDYGDVTAVSDLTLAIGTGEVFGLIGPNGAGKTSLIRVLATLSEPTYGNAVVAGFNIFEDRTRARRQIGYMPDLAPVFKDIRCWEFLDLFAAAYGLGRTERRRRIDETLEIVDLTRKRTAMAGTLSRGMTQRLVLAKTMLHDPAVLLLDEPASGLDPIARIDLRNLLRDLSARGKTVLISSHILSDLNDFCSSIGIMEQGRLVLSGAIEDLVGTLNAARRFTVQTVGTPAKAAEVLAGHEGVTDIKHESNRCTFVCTFSDEHVANLLRDLINEGVPIVAFHEQKRGVEDLMMQVGATEVS